jgi:hypothetical protein
LNHRESLPSVNKTSHCGPILAKQPNPSRNRMKRLNFLLSLISLLFIGMHFSSCVQGPEGPPGRDGNANVLATTVTSSAWVFNSPSWVLALPDPYITPDIVDFGAVVVYVASGNGFTQLPLTFYTNPNYSTTIEVSHYVGGVTLFWTDSDLFQPTNPGTRTFKIVKIAGTLLRENPDLDLSNYEAVKHRFNLKD